jgi:acetyl-CoA carboxylase biotin carboxyl carrier protein
MNLKELKELIEIVSEKGFAEFEIERQGFRLRISRFNQHAGPVAQTGAGPLLAPEGSGTQPGVSPEATSEKSEHPDLLPSTSRASEADSLRKITSPIVGTFFRAPSPTSEPFVQVGDRVSPDSVVCIIEAMKLMNEIHAEISGVIAEIYPENGQAVEYGEPLFAVRA